MIRRGCFFLLLLANVSSFASNVTISGKATGYEGKSVSVITVKDFISNTHLIIGKSKVDAEGNFTVSAEIDQIKYALLKIGHVSSIIYLQPDSKYTITFPQPDEKTALSLDETKVEMIFDSLDVMDINNLIIDFDYRYDYFVSKNLLILHKPEFKIELDTFKQKITRVYKEIKIPFFKNYVYYSTAMLEMMGDMENNQMMSKVSVYEQYIRGRKIEYQHDKYMWLFNEFYAEPFSNLSNEINEKLYAAVNEKASLKLLADVVLVNGFAGNENVRELVVIKGIMENYYRKEFDQENLLLILDSVVNHGISTENREVAANVYHKLTYLSKGFAAPDFSLTTLKGDTVTLSQFRGKMVYLSFWSTWNTNAVSELRLYSGYQKRYGKCIEYVCINMDENKKDFTDFMKKHPDYNWYFLDGNSDPHVQELYEIKSLPTYFLIDEDGKFRQSPALRPMPNGTFKSIDETFHNIYWNKKRAGETCGEDK